MLIQKYLFFRLPFDRWSCTGSDRSPFLPTVTGSAGSFDSTARGWTISIWHYGLCGPITPTDRLLSRHDIFDERVVVVWHHSFFFSEESEVEKRRFRWLWISVFIGLYCGTGSGERRKGGKRNGTIERGNVRGLEQKNQMSAIRFLEGHIVDCRHWQCVTGSAFPRRRSRCRMVRRESLSGGTGMIRCDSRNRHDVLRCLCTVYPRQ